MTKEDKKQLEIEIKHIFESGVNELRIYNMVVDFIEKRYKSKNRKGKFGWCLFMNHEGFLERHYFKTKEEADKCKTKVFFTDEEQWESTRHI